MHLPFVLSYYDDHWQKGPVLFLENGFFQFWSGIKYSAAIFVHYLPNHLIDIFHSAICNTIFSTKTVLSVLRTVIFSNGFDHLILVTVFISEQKTKHKTKLTWAALFPFFLGFPNSQFSILGPILNKLFPSLLIVLDTSLVINQANTIEFWL